MTTVGIIGVGHLIKHVLPGIIKSGYRFLISKRGEQTSRYLAERYSCEVLSDNQEILDLSDIVILSVRPKDLIDLTNNLSFKENQLIISFCAGVRLSELQPTIDPAHGVLAMPVVAAELKESPTLLYPNNKKAEQLLSCCGPVIIAEDEDVASQASAIACYYGWVIQLIKNMSDWTVSRGLSENSSRLLVSQMTRAAATVARERTETNLQGLVDELATEGSFTLKGLNVLNKRNAFDPWIEAADSLYPKQTK